MPTVSRPGSCTCLHQKRNFSPGRGLAPLPHCSSVKAPGVRCRPAASSFRKVSETACALALSCLLTGSSYAAEPSEVFQRSGCVGCHAGGGNVVQAGASLQYLQKNGAATSDAIYKLVYYGKGKMPGYGKDCMPRGKCTFGPRLSDEDIQRLSKYVLNQAAVKWK